jgi:Glycosyltransferase family 87
MRRLAGLLALLLFALLCRGRYRAPDTQWDFELYYAAARADAAGLDPYDRNAFSLASKLPLVFVYPPHALWIFRPLVRLDYTQAARAFLTLKIAAATALLAVLAFAFLGDGSDGRFYLFALLAFKGAIWIDIQSGNVTMFEQLALWIGFWFFLRRRYMAFTACVLVAASFKIVPIVFLALLLGTSDRRRVMYVIGGAGAFASLLTAEYLFEPGPFVAFIRNATTLQLGDLPTYNPSSLMLVQSLTEAVRARLHIPLPVGLDWMLYALIAAGVIGATWRAWHTSRLMGDERMQVLVCLACLVTALALPRFKSYSFIQVLLPTYLLMRRLGERTPFVFGLFFLVAVASLPDVGPLGHGAANYYPLFVTALVWAVYLRGVLGPWAQPALAASTQAPPF